MFLTQIIGCIVAALVVAVLWLGVELHGIKRDADRRNELDGLIEKAKEAEFEMRRVKGEMYVTAGKYMMLIDEMKGASDDS